MLRTRGTACSIALALASLAPVAAIAQAHHHRHGIATLELAAGGTDLTLRLVAPLESLVGFEHAPRTRAQEAAVARMRETFERPEHLFHTDPAARCRPARRNLRSPVLPGTPSADSAERDRGAESHGDFEASYVFECARPDALRSLDAGPLFAAFARLRRIDAQLVTPTVQAQRRLERARARARLVW